MFSYYLINEIIIVYRDIHLVAVDIDPAMLKIATNYFGLVQDEKMEIVIEDGIEFLNKSAKKGKNAEHNLETDKITII